MITQKFPPFSGVGVIRVSKFAKYLHEFGWRPIILTCKHSTDHIDALDNEKLNELPSDHSVHRVPCPSLYSIYRLFGRAKQGSFALSDSRAYSGVRSIFVPDPYVGWYFTGLYEARKIFQNYQIDCIYSTSPRETPHLIGKTLRRKYQCPWIADFRDPWIEKVHRAQRIDILDRFERHLEKKVLKEADRLVVAWPGIAEGFERAVPGISEKLNVLTNGFDAQDFHKIQHHIFERFTLLYAGSIFKDLAPEPLFQALYLLHTAYPKLHREFQLVLLGRQDGYVRSLIRTYQLENMVRILEQVPHKTSLKYMLGAHMLFFSVPDKKWIPSKIFEYLRASRPILALAEPDADSVRIIQSVASARYLASRSPEEISKFLFYSLRHQMSNQIADQPEMYQCFERKTLTGRLADILNKVSGKK